MAQGKRIILLGYATATSGTALSLSGLGLQAGDFVFAWSNSHAGWYGMVPGTPSGWTSAISGVINYTHRVLAVYRRMGSSPDASVTLKDSSYSAEGVMMAVAFRGVRAESPIIALATGANTVDLPSLSAGGNPYAVSLAVGLGNVSVTGNFTFAGPPSGWTYINQVYNATNDYSQTAAAYRFPVTGTVDPPAFALNNSTQGAKGCFHVLIAG